VTTWHPDSIHVVSGDRHLKLHDPSVVGDSLAGRIPVTRSDSIGVLRRDVAAVKPKGRGAVLVLRDSSILEVTDLWERGDSLGGPGVPRRRWERVAIPLADITWIELPALPGQDPWRPGVRLPLAHGQTVRLQMASADSTPAEDALLRGGVSRMTTDSLVVTVDAAERQIALASITRLDVLTGHGHNAGWGVLIGIVVGAAGGAAFGDASGAPAAVSVAVTIPAGVLAGGCLGLIAGAAYRTERWQTVPLPRSSQAPRP
jgi:hypothetical protein